MMNFPSSPTVGQVYTPFTGLSYQWDGVGWKGANSLPVDRLQSTTADMSAGFKTSGNRFVVNDGPNLGGTDVMTVTEGGVTTTGGNIVSGGSVTANGAIFNGQTTQVLLCTTGAGTVILRPNGSGSGTGQTTIDSAGAMTTAAGITATTGSLTVSAYCISNAGAFIGNAAQAILGTPSSTAGNVFLRPNGYGSATGQTTIDSAGVMTTSGAITAGGNVSAAGHSVPTFSTTGLTAGWTVSAARVNSSANIGTSYTHYAFYNTNGNIGTISTNASATAYTTSSDERLKNVGSDYDPQEAIRIIREDPVKNFQWKAGNVDAVGWIAQHSRSVHEDLATYVPPREAGEKGEPAEDEFWGIDYGKRTPYLWAALTHALDKIDVLEARLAALEGAA